VQLARSIGARITGVCGTANIEYVRSIGAERVIDYKAGDWLQLDQRFDVIFDAAAAASFAQARPLLAPRGIYINTMPRPALYWAAAVARATSPQRCVPFLLKTDAALLQRLAKLAADGVIVRTFTRSSALPGWRRRSAGCNRRGARQGVRAGRVLKRRPARGLR